MSLEEEIEKRPRGAPPGNRNAVKHNFYSAKFSKSERTALEKGEFTGLSEEIALLRLFIRRVVAQSLQDDNFYENLETLRVVSLACSSLSRLVRTHSLLAMSGDDEVSRTIDLALKSVVEELGLR